MKMKYYRGMSLWKSFNGTRRGSVDTEPIKLEIVPCSNALHINSRSYYEMVLIASSFLASEKLFLKEMHCLVHVEECLCNCL